MTITIGAMGRIQIGGILGQQRVDVKSLHTLSSLFQKFDIPEAEKEKMLRPVGNGMVITDKAAIDAFPEADIELEDAEVRRLREVLNSFTGYAPTDLAWLEPVLKSLG